MPLRKPGEPARMPQPVAPAALEAALAGGTAAERRAAARDLADAPDAVATLAAALAAEAEASVRAAIVGALVGASSEAAVEALVRSLTSEDAGLRNVAVEALQQMGDVAAPEVARLLGAGEPDLRIFAVNVLEGLRPQFALPLLARVLDDDPDLNVGLAAVEALAQLGGPAETGALRRFAARFPAEPFVGFAVDLACRRMAAGGTA